MRVELEEEVRDVNEDEDDRGTAAELEKIRRLETAIDSAVQPFVLNETSEAAWWRKMSGEYAYECGGDDQRDDRDCHQGRIQLGCHGLEFLGAESESADCGEKRKP